jgi:1-deoxy-D-xylulose-5-phosphate reductoisomerase
LPDTKNFKNLTLAFEALRKGGNHPCILNAANEIVVEAFLSDKIGFLEKSRIIEQTLEKIPYIAAPEYENYKQTNEEAQRYSRSLIKS